MIYERYCCWDKRKAEPFFHDFFLQSSFFFSMCCSYNTARQKPTYETVLALPSSYFW